MLPFQLMLAAKALPEQSRFLPEQSHILQTLTAAEIYFPIALCAIGALLMVSGFKAYRWIVILNFIALGYWLGNILGDRMQIGIIGGVVGAVLLGIAAIPLKKYAVAVCGGLIGAVVGMVLWTYCQQPLNMAWAGGLIGLVLVGMLAFILFKTTVILFTSLEGAGMFVLGSCALAMRYDPWSKQVGTSLDSKPVLLPLLVVSLATVALFWQHQRHGLIGNDGAPGGGGTAGSGAKSSGESKKK